MTNIDAIATGMCKAVVPNTRARRCGNLPSYERMPWERPSSVPVGRVWSRFQGKSRNGAPPVMYQIRDMEESNRKQCLDMMQKTFLEDEPLCRILDVDKDPESVATIRANWEGFVSQKISVACFTEENGEPKDLVGFNNVLVKRIHDEEEDIEKVKGESWKKLLRILTAAENLVNIFSHYGVDMYMTTSGMTVIPEHRGQNIGARIIEARKEMCKAFGIKAVATVYTAKASQVLAAKCGYTVLATLPYTDMLKEGIDVTNCGTPSALLMGIKYDFEDEK